MWMIKLLLTIMSHPYGISGHFGAGKGGVLTVSWSPTTQVVQRRSPLSQAWGNPRSRAWELDSADSMAGPMGFQ